MTKLILAFRNFAKPPKMCIITVSYTSYQSHLPGMPDMYIYVYLLSVKTQRMGTNVITLICFMLGVI